MMDLFVRADLNQNIRLKRERERDIIKFCVCRSGGKAASKVRRLIVSDRHTYLLTEWFCSQKQVKRHLGPSP